MRLRIKTFFFLIIPVLFSTLPSAAAFDPDSVRGPKTEKLCMVIIKNSDAQILAAERGELDIIGDITRPSDIERLGSCGKFNMSLARGFHAFFLLMNNGAKPWNDPDVRRAAALAIDRSGIVRSIYAGYCEPINSWLPPVSPWSLPDAARDIYDPEAARQILKKAGYATNITGRLTAPDGQPLEKIKLLTPLANVAPTTAEMAERVADALYALGFPVDVEPMDFSAMIGKLDRRDYSLAVMAWGMGVNPDSLYSFYHSSMDVEGGYNLTSANDGVLDRELERLRFAFDKESAEAAADTVQRRLAELVPSVPIYSRYSVSAVSKGWKGVFSTDKMTADNIWTLLMAEPADGKARTLNMLLTEEPRSLNPFVASSAYSWQVLGVIYESMISTDPMTLEDMPGLAESWETERIREGGSEHTLLRFRLKDGLKWNDGSPVTAEDMKATIDFMRGNSIPRFFDAVKDVMNVTAEGNELTVKMDGVSYWFLDNIGGLPCLPKRVIESITNWQSWDPLDREEKFGAFGLVGTGPFVFDEYRPGEYVMFRRNPHYRLLRGEGSI